MLSFAVKCLLGLATVNAWTQPDQPGAGVSLTKKGANNIKDIIAPYIFGLTQDIQVAEVDFDGGNLTDLVIKLPQPPLEDIGINTEHATNGVELFASGVGVTISSNFKYTYWITVSGEAAIKIQKASVDVEVDLSEQTTSNGQKAPYLTVQKVNINVNPDNVDITLTGGLASKIAGAFIPYLKSTVIPDVITTLETTIKTGIDTTINADIAEYGTHITIPELGGVTADYAQMETNAQINSASTFEMTVNGTFYNANHTAATVYPDPVAFDVIKAGGRSLQGHLTQYVVNTALEAAYTSDNELNVSTLLYQLLKVNITTTSFKDVLPQMITKYGENVTMDLSGKLITKKTYIEMIEGHAEAHGWLALTGKVGDSEAFHGEFAAGKASATVHTTSDGTLFGSIPDLSIGTLNPATYRNNLGVTAAQMQTQLQTLVT